jgi:transcriptional regulator with XRE-family HTH domain
VAKTEKDFLLNLFGKHLAVLRRQKNITQDELSFDADIDIGTLSKLERGLLNISIYNAYKIAKALNIPYKELFDFKLPAQKK